MTTYSITLISKTSLANHFEKFLKTFTDSNSVSISRDRKLKISRGCMSHDLEIIDVTYETPRAYPIEL